MVDRPCATVQTVRPPPPCCPECGGDVVVRRFDGFPSNWAAVCKACRMGSALGAEAVRNYPDAQRFVVDIEGLPVEVAVFTEKARN